MTKNFPRIALLAILLFLINTNCQAQLSPIDFENGGYGATWTWTTFENASNPPVQIVANPFPGGINLTDKVAKFTALQAGQPWAGFESFHGGGIGTFTLNANNCIVKLMVYKSVISDVGVKFVTPSSASTGELKVPNTLINQWEELTFDFTSQIGHPAMIGIDQIVIFPDFDLGGRTTDNICYSDNIRMGTPSTPIQVTFATQNTDSLPVYVFGNWNNWSNFPGAPMILNTLTGNYEATLPIPSSTTIEYLYVNGISTKEVLDSSWTCTNGNATFTNRLSNLGTADTTLCNIWQSCTTCSPLAIENIKNEAVEIILSQHFMRMNSSTISFLDEIKIYDLMGKIVFSSNGNIRTNQNIPVELKNNTFYILLAKKGTMVYKLKSIITN